MAYPPSSIPSPVWLRSTSSSADDTGHTSSTHPSLLHHFHTGSTSVCVSELLSPLVNSHHKCQTVSDLVSTLCKWALGCSCCTPTLFVLLLFSSVSIPLFSLSNSPVCFLFFFKNNARLLFRFSWRTAGQSVFHTLASKQSSLVIKWWRLNLDLTWNHDASEVDVVSGSEHLKLMSVWQMKSWRFRQDQSVQFV